MAQCTQLLTMVLFSVVIFSTNKLLKGAVRGQLLNHPENTSVEAWHLGFCFPLRKKCAVYSWSLHTPAVVCQWEARCCGVVRVKHQIYALVLDVFLVAYSEYWVMSDLRYKCASRPLPCLLSWKSEVILQAEKCAVLQTKNVPRLRAVNKKYFSL